MTYKDHHLIPDWAVEAVYDAQKRGVMQGSDNGFFYPNEPVTRAELACTLFKQNKSFHKAIPIAEQTVVTLYSDQHYELGSGTIISPQGHIITNRHVVEKAQGEFDKDLIVRDMQNRIARLVNVYALSDMAVLKLENYSGPHMSLSQSLPRKGQAVIVVGAPYGIIDDTITKGIISGYHNHLHYGDVFMTDAPINPGNSGGAVVTEYGEYVGMPTYIITNSQSMGFCLTVESIRTYLKAVGGVL